MAKSIFKDADVFVNTEKISSLSNEMTLEYGATEQTTTDFQDDTDVIIGGLKNASVSVSGYWDSTSAGGGDPDKVFFDAIGNSSEQPAILVPESTSDRALLLQSAMITYNIGGSIGEVFPFDMDMSATEDLTRGRYTDQVDVSSSGSSGNLVLDGGNVGSNEELVAVLIVYDGASAGDTLDVTIDDSGATTHITFDQVSGDTKTFQIKTVDGAISDDTFTVDWTISSGSSNWSFVVAFGKRSK